MKTLLIGTLTAVLVVMGGLQPFDPSGSALPTVQSVVAPNTFPQGSNMNVRIRAKGN